MKKEEKIALDYLKSEGLGQISYEPDGKVPPDFAVGSHIAVEVRRLNENYFSVKKTEGLENHQIRLFQCIERLLKTYALQSPTESFWLALDYKRPIGQLKSIYSNLKKALDSFLQSDRRTPHRSCVSPTVAITLLRCPQRSIHQFRIGIDVDEDSGGILVDLYVSNILYCITEKSEKIKPYLSKYREWWLILVDALGWGFDRHEVPDIKKSLSKPAEWNRILLIDPTNGRKRIEL